jgi:sec-independent protein translocase protein TatC
MAAGTTARERDKELSLVQHLGELRDRLVFSAIALVATTTICFFFTTQLIRILLVPVDCQFIPTFVCANPPHHLVSLSPTENFVTYFRVALFAGIALAMPVILYEIYAYIDPALLPNERRFIRLMGLPVIALFIVGMLFCYFILLPNAIKFLINFGSEVIENQLRASDYLSFVTVFILGMGIVFEVPVIIFALVRIHVLSRAWLAKQRRYVFFLAFLIGAVITPTPDPFNQTLVAIPMYLLFELGLFASRFAGGSRAAS